MIDGGEPARQLHQPAVRHADVDPNRPQIEVIGEKERERSEGACPGNDPQAAKRRSVEIHAA
jgi:hypothetical protein